MTRLSSIFSAWLNKALNFIKCNARFNFLFLMGLTLLVAYTGDLFPLLSLTLVILALLTMYVAQLTREAAKDDRDAAAKVGRLWFEFALAFAASLVVAAIQYDQQERIDVRQSDLQKEIAARSDYFNAISQLGSLSPVVRMSGIDYLNKICMGEKKEPHPDKCNKDDTITLLINQVRFFTQSKSYQEDFAEEPARDIAKIIDILRERQELRNIVWNGAYLRGADLRGANLQGADMEKANLQGANLYKANLQEADLLGANLQGAGLVRANLQGAELHWANLQGANLYEANLQRAVLYETDLQGAYLRETNLQGADLLKANLQGANLRRANLQGANLYRAKLQGADLQWAKLQGANLYMAKLQGTNLYEAKLQEADLGEAHLQGAYSEDEFLLVNFCTRIISRMGKPTEIEEENVVFSGGITEELWEEMNKTQWHDEKVKENFLSKMEDHLNKEPVYTIPDKFKNTVNTDNLTKETAAAIIKEYNESLTDEQARCELP